MINTLKGWLSDWRITVALVGGALVVGSSYGSCTFQPGAEATTEAAPEVVQTTTTETIETVDVKDMPKTTEVETVKTNNTVEASD